LVLLLVLAAEAALLCWAVLLLLASGADVLESLA
jgi:hypothetical protein